MKKAEVLEELIGMAVEFNSPESVRNNSMDSNLYGDLYDILIKRVGEEEKEVVLAIDNMVGTLLGNSFDDGFISGLEVANILKKITEEPQNIFREVLNNKKNNDIFYREIYELIEKYKMN